MIVDVNDTDFEFNMLEKGYDFEDVIEYMGMSYQNLLSLEENEKIFMKYNNKA